MSRAEWMNGICLIWSRGRLISPSLPVGDDRYLNLSSQKRPTGRNLGGNRLVRRSGTTSRGTVVLVFCLRMRRFPPISYHIPISYHVRGNEMNCLVGSSEYMTVFSSFTRASFLNMRADQSSSWMVRNRPFCLAIAFANNQKWQYFATILFFNYIWIYLRVNVSKNQTTFEIRGKP